MTNKEKELVETYFKYKDLAEENKRLANETKKTLSTLAPHKVGEIVKWTEHKSKNLGSGLHPNYVDLPPVERKAVVTRISVNVWRYKDKDVTLTYAYEFRPFKKDGGVSLNQCYPSKDIIEWTGEIHESYKEQTGEV